MHTAIIQLDHLNVIAIIVIKETLMSDAHNIQILAIVLLVQM